MNKNIVLVSLGVLILSCAYLLYVNYKLKKQIKLIQGGNNDPRLQSQNSTQNNIHHFQNFNPKGDDIKQQVENYLNKEPKNTNTNINSDSG